MFQVLFSAIRQPVSRLCCSWPATAGSLVPMSVQWPVSSVAQREKHAPVIGAAVHACCCPMVDGRYSCDAAASHMITYLSACFLAAQQFPVHDDCAQPHLRGLFAAHFRHTCICQLFHDAKESMREHFQFAYMNSLPNVNICWSDMLSGHMVSVIAQGRSIAGLHMLAGPHPCMHRHTAKHPTESSWPVAGGMPLPEWCIGVLGRPTGR